MQKTKEGHYQLRFKPTPKAYPMLEYKYAKGGWEAEELYQDGNTAANRRIIHASGQIQDIVPKWKNHNNEYDPAYYPEVEIVAKQFKLPQLRRRRRIAVLLPHNYHQTQKRYPVLYLQDGQNLFEESAPFGTWGVDKQLAKLAKAGLGDVIIVAIDHGGKDRIQEYMPYDTPKWGEGLGRAYAQFLVETLKPYIDRKYRTCPERKFQGIGGSSMGGLISIFAGLLYPKVFSKFMIFSPSLWISPRIYLDSQHFALLPQTKVYLYAGGKEGSGMVENAAKFKSAIQRRGMSPHFLQFNLDIDPEGHHNEFHWGQVFPKAVQWLYHSEAYQTLAPTHPDQK
jgi:predicted alpha/beta superfamily hydrolase